MIYYLDRVKSSGGIISNFLSEIEKKKKKTDLCLSSIIYFFVYFQTAISRASLINKCEREKSVRVRVMWFLIRYVLLFIYSAYKDRC